MTYLPTVKRENLVAFYPFSEGSGSTVYDYSGDGNDGTISGAVYVKIKDGGYTLDFDGSNDYVSATNFMEDLAAFSTSLWFKADSITASDNIEDADFLYSIGGVYYGAWFSSGNDITIRSYDGNIFDITTISTFSTSTWYHIVHTYDGSTHKIYVDGSEDVSQSSTVNIYGSTGNNLIIGAQGGGSIDQFFDGKISNVTIYNVALTAEEVKTLYKQTYINT